MIDYTTYPNWEELIRIVGEEQIAKKYVKGFDSVGKKFKLRYDDKSPSCSIIYYGGKLRIKDFGDSVHPKARSILQFVMDEYNISYIEALQMIMSDFNINPNIDFKNQHSFTLTSVGKKNESVNIPTFIDVIYRNWTKKDEKYWKQFYLNLDFIESHNIRPISFFKYGKENLYSKIIKAEELSYVYNFYYYLTFRRKIYQPESVILKWLGNADSTVVQNIDSISKEGGDLLIIQSSYKDAMVMENLGYNSIAPVSESSWFTDSYWNKLNKRWKKIIYYGNNDFLKSNNPGLGYSKYISFKYNIPYITNPDNTESDVSDYIKKFNLEKTKQMVETLINSTNDSNYIRQTPNTYKT